MRRISLNRRLSQDEAHDDDVELVLIKISHPDLDEPILLSSDPTERVSIEPVIYGNIRPGITQAAIHFTF
jgi:hypothetical protein